MSVSLIWLLFYADAAGPRAFGKHLHLRSSFSKGTGCSKGRRVDKLQPNLILLPLDSEPRPMIENKQLF